MPKMPKTIDVELFARLPSQDEGALRADPIPVGVISLPVEMVRNRLGDWQMKIDTSIFQRMGEFLDGKR
ncbi:hypothetical protein [Rhodococcus globerulus]|uniref:hypothetical protein n=1 Tax=Rhodococcus globerulus TaxID=33008 RepID=UPI001C55AC49|nr:hypothetical protein [Rhodococcus globerulus]QXW04010.1 hypothetical protein KYT97_08320 [Rhodococcus globerulus]